MELHLNSRTKPNICIPHHVIKHVCVWVWLAFTSNPPPQCRIERLSWIPYAPREPQRADIFRVDGVIPPMPNTLISREGSGFPREIQPRSLKVRIQSSALEHASLTRASSNARLRLEPVEYPRVSAICRNQDRAASAPVHFPMRWWSRKSLRCRFGTVMSIGSSLRFWQYWELGRDGWNPERAS